MVSANNSINDTVGASISGVTNTLTVTNPSNTASSAARTTITVGGGTAADPTLNFNVNGVTNWEMGIDNNDSDKWKLSQGTSLGTNDTIVAYTGGNIVKPLTCAFYAYLTATVSNVTGDGTYYTVIFDTEVQDIGGNYDNTTGIFTAPVDGTYLFANTINYANLAPGHGINDDFNYNNATIRMHGWGGAYTNSAMSPGGTIIFPMSAGDTMRMNAHVYNGAKTVNIIGSVAIPNWHPTYFCGYLLG